MHGRITVHYNDIFAMEDSQWTYLISLRPGLLLIGASSVVPQALHRWRSRSASGTPERQSESGPIIAFVVKQSYMWSTASELRSSSARFPPAAHPCQPAHARHRSTNPSPGPRLYTDGPVSTREDLRGCSLIRGVRASRSCYRVDSFAPGLVGHWQGYD